MQQLIKITSVPIQTMSYRQNGRLVSSDSVDLERRKALARRMSFHRSASRGGSSLPMKDITKINRTFSKRVSAAPQGQNISRHEAAFHQAQTSVPQMTSPSVPVFQNPSAMAADFSSSENTYVEAQISVAATASTMPASTGISMEAGSSYATERGAFEMKVAKGELTFLPPMVMTIVTQYPELHFEYLGDFNYVPPRNPQVGGNINLAT